MKLFQIEEPDGGPTDPSAPGAAIGIDLAGGEVEAAFSVGGNAAVLADREGFEHTLPVPDATAVPASWQEVLEAARIRAERALARPVSHAVIVLPSSGDAELLNKLREASEAAGLRVLRFSRTSEVPADITAALAAAILAEDLAPRPQ